VCSAGNGAAMRAAIVGAFISDRPRERATFGRSLAEVTHRDVRAVEGALYVAEMTAGCLEDPDGTPRAACQGRARRIVNNIELGNAVDRARDLSLVVDESLEAARALGTTGFVVHSVAFATYCFLRHGDDPLSAITKAICAGGDTDTIGAIPGGWLGALFGESGLPHDLIDRIHDGPFGPTHLRKLADCLAHQRLGLPYTVPRYSVTAAMARNLALYPVILVHGFRRLLLF